MVPRVSITNCKYDIARNHVGRIEREEVKDTRQRKRGSKETKRRKQIKAKERERRVLKQSFHSLIHSIGRGGGAGPGAGDHHSRKKKDKGVMMSFLLNYQFVKSVNILSDPQHLITTLF